MDEPPARSSRRRAPSPGVLGPDDAAAQRFAKQMRTIQGLAEQPGFSGVSLDELRQQATRTYVEQMEVINLHLLKNSLAEHPVDRGGVASGVCALCVMCACVHVCECACVCLGVCVGVCVCVFVCGSDSDSEPPRRKRTRESRCVQPPPPFVSILDNKCNVCGHLVWRNHCTLLSLFNHHMLYNDLVVVA